MFEQEQKQEQPQVENVPAQNQINYPSNKLLFGFLPFNNTIKKIFIAIIVLVVLTGLYWLIAESGISAIIQPGGSVRDNEVIEACNEHGIAMVFTGVRCFNHG